MSKAYKEAGVDIEAGNETVQRIQAHVQRTRRTEVMGLLGGFGGLFDLGAGGWHHPVLVSATDGVGTKLKIALTLDRHDTIGIDCVAMCVNDIVVQGAEPLFFLDYISTGKLNPEQAEQIVKGIADGCEEAGCALIGGETAEMPGMYPSGEYDVAGFAVGAVEKTKLVTGDSIKPGDVLLGLASEGLHSNGYSLVRKVLLEQDPSRLERDSLLAEELLQPTRIYVRSLLGLQQAGWLKGAAHITGGGLVENIPRMLPNGLCAELDGVTWKLPDIFDRVQREGKIAQADMIRTFNMGVGMVICVAANLAEEVSAYLEERGERVYQVGRVIEGDTRFSWKGELL
ncbi:phosphoribosylformylglycinamidine cyclo-ligase [Mechercharimyces sp. CAU 1602]|uniref:phosphoribosylformylglycinamidine cyclo-ligase n=1 Tax=Mechercharimyces sp. CAU 1602 TaxID=2973933 RepID=UPI0021613B67|nr:phosphoribosylformylglycinamidine cyclo-ligase [Mechercharimyces sp. CAU 1602]MCS1352015.1 phosphoribosylformylglycinamidine cyclo-ligase [Mechercharimyces sp. CAU 1602]